MIDDEEETGELNAADFIRELQTDFEGAATAAEAVRKIGPDTREILALCDTSYKQRFEDLVVSIFNLQAQGKDPIEDETVVQEATLVFDDDNYWDAMASLVRKRLCNALGWPEPQQARLS